MLSFIDVAHSSLYKTCQGHNIVNVKDTTRSMSRTQQGQCQGNNKVNVNDTARSMSRTQQGQCQGHNNVNVKDTTRSMSRYQMLLKMLLSQETLYVNMNKHCKG